MKFVETALQGVFVLETEWATDARGAFGRTFSTDEFQSVGADAAVAQTSVSRNPQSGTLRGLHLQREPFGETKVIRCLRGEIFDVAVDLRPDGETFGCHHAVRLSERNGLGFLLPPGVAHGFLTLVPDCDIWYQMSTAYVPGAAAGVRYDDAELAIEWPAPVHVVSDRDRALPLLREFA